MPPADTKPTNSAKDNEMKQSIKQQLDNALDSLADAKPRTEQDWVKPLRLAVEEIGRLEKELNRWMLVAERFAESDPKFDAFHAYFKERFRD